MRRRDREITDMKDILAIIGRNKVCRLGFCDQGEAYIVPLNFGFEYFEGILKFYFHCAKKGRKIDLAKSCPHVSFEIDGAHKLAPVLPGEPACKYGFFYDCIMGIGKITFLDGTEKTMLFLCSCVIR